MIEVDTTALDRMVPRVRGLAQQIKRPAGIMRIVAQGVELQTKHRIRNEKTAPDGKRWAPWSEAYAKTRKKGLHSLLMDTWAMVDEKLGSKSTATTATIFNTREWAGRHQTGGFSLGARGSATVLPARPFLGLSRDNADDIQNWLAPALEQMTAESLGGRPSRG